MEKVGRSILHMDGEILSDPNDYGAPMSGMDIAPTSGNTSTPETMCCCIGGAKLPYQDPAPWGCCCGSTDYCCGSRDGFADAICADSDSCTVVMTVLFAAIAIGLALSIATLLYAKLKRIRREEAASTAYNAQSQKFQEELDALSDDEINAMFIKQLDEESPAGSVYKSSSNANQAGDDHHKGSNQEAECPICLESNPHTALFPCSHCICQPCLRDLVKHTDKKTDALHGVVCPLCRKLAVLHTAQCVALIASVDDDGAEEQRQQRRGWRFWRQQRRHAAQQQQPNSSSL